LKGMASGKAGLKEGRDSAVSNSVVAFMDMGTNSVRIMIVRISPNHSYTIISARRR